MIHDDYNRHQLIQDYLDGKLSGEALADFQQQLQNDPVMEEEMTIMSHMQKAFAPEDEQIKTVRQSLQEVHRQNSPARSAKTRKLGFRLLSLAAAILLLVTFVFMWPKTSGPDQLYADYAKHDLLSLSTRSIPADDLTSELEQAFNEQQYQEALNLSTSYLVKYPDAYNVLLAKGISELELGKYEAALSTFKEIEQSDLRINKGKWYQAMTYLKKGDIEQCRSVLNDIVSSKSYQHQQALELLKKL